MADVSEAWPVMCVSEVRWGPEGHGDVSEVGRMGVSVAEECCVSESNSAR